MDENRIKCQQCNTEYDKKFLLGKQGNIDICPMCGANMQDGDDQSDWITWYYYGVKDEKGSKVDLYFLEDNPIDVEKPRDKISYYLIKEFKAPPKDENGNCDAAKRELKKYIPNNAFVENSVPSPEVRCPRCGSTQIQIVPKKFGILTGVLTPGYNRVCVRCQTKF